MNNNKLGLLFIIAVVTLAGVSASYAGYTDIITITGTVTTGSVDMELDHAYGTWFWKDICIGQGHYDGHRRLMHQTILTQEYSTLFSADKKGNDETANNDGWYDDPCYELYSYATAFADENDEDIIHVEFNNIYPIDQGTPDAYTLVLKLHYVGKTPARIVQDSLQFSDIIANELIITPNGPHDQIIPSNTDGLNWIEYLIKNQYVSWDFVHDDGTGKPDFNNNVNECDQFHYCDYIWLIIRGAIPQHNAFQGLTGSMSFHFEFLQFDEVDCGDVLEDYASVSDFVWHDINNNGIQDDTEPGIPGVHVSLYNEGGILIAETDTDSTGYYEFIHLTPGNYYIEFSLPAGYEFTSEDQGGDDERDSDVDPSTHQTDIFTLAPGENNTTIDAGMRTVCIGSIGDHVWNDLNQNGLQDEEEPGVEGITVHLLYPLNDDVLDSTTTDEDGYYSFIGLGAGNYKIQFIQPDGYYFTSYQTGSDHTKDNDADTDGYTPVIIIGCNGENDTIDAGLIQVQQEETCIKIQKTLFGPYTDPETGLLLSSPEPDQLIHVGDHNEPGWPTTFYLNITVINTGTTILEDVTVEDTILNNVAPRDAQYSQGSVVFTPLSYSRIGFGFDEMTWTIGTLQPEDAASINITIHTLPNPTGKYEPTSYDQDIPINEGATVTATSEDCDLTATTGPITINIQTYDMENNLGQIIEQLPINTPWAESCCPTGEGCCPGEWRDNTEEWIGYTTDQLIGDIFTIPSLYDSITNDELLNDVLYYVAGPDDIDHAKILLRSAIASLLNAAHPLVTYPKTETEIIDQVNTALASDRTAMITLCEQLCNYNDINNCFLADD